MLREYSLKMFVLLQIRKKHKVYIHLFSYKFVTNMEIKKVKQRKDGTKNVIIPKHSDIDEGDYVMIKKVDEETKCQ